jgi:site-specific recombinase XerD
MMWVQGLSANTEIAYRHEAAAFKAFLDGRPLLSAQVADLQKYAYALQQGRLSLSSQCRALTSLQSLYRFATDVDEINRDPARALRLPRSRDKLALRILTVKQVRQIIAAAKRRIPTFSRKTYTVLEAVRLLGYQPAAFWTLAKEEGWKVSPSDVPGQPFYGRVKARDLRKSVKRAPPYRDYVLIRFLYETGCRISEALGTRWPDFMPKKGGAAVVTLYGKGHKTRSVEVGADVWCLLQPLRQGGGREHFTRTVFHMAERSGIDARPSPHWFRHSHATHALDGGCPIHVLKEQLGHASLMSTERYLHVRPGESSGHYLPKVDRAK